jgi:hypothetical protein
MVIVGIHRADDFTVPAMSFTDFDEELVEEILPSLFGGYID